MDCHVNHFVFTIDVEDWFQVENLKSCISPSDWDHIPLRVVDNTRRILDIFHRHDIRATFFFLGWIAERVPELVVETCEAGHEIACHGFGHELLHTISRDEIRSDLERALKILQPLVADCITGYRSPSFSINNQGADTLKELGFRYDASYNRFQFNSRYGSLAFDETPEAATNRIHKPIRSLENSRILRFKNGLIEFPVSINTYMGIHWPLGGGYFRLSPTGFLKRQVHDALHLNSCSTEADLSGPRQVSVYLHPWEFDSGQPSVRGLNPLFRLRHYYGLRRTAEKFEQFISFVKSVPGVKITTFREITDTLT